MCVCVHVTTRITPRGNDVDVTKKHTKSTSSHTVCSYVKMYPYDDPIPYIHISFFINRKLRSSLLIVQVLLFFLLELSGIPVGK